MSGPLSIAPQPIPGHGLLTGRNAVVTAAALRVATSISLLIGTVLVQRERARTEVNYQLATTPVDDLLTQAGAIDLAEVAQM